jgi:hypothetical protein
MCGLSHEEVDDWLVDVPGNGLPQSDGCQLEHEFNSPTIRDALSDIFISQAGSNKGCGGS